MSTIAYHEMAGWINDPTAHAAVRATLPMPLFAAAAPHLAGTGEGKTVLLYQAWKDVLKAFPSYIAQQIGDCCSFGWGHGVDLLQCVQIALGHKAEAYKETSTEALYGEGREAGGMLGGGDGCYGSAMAKAVTTMGVVPRELVGPYDGQRAKSWGSRGTPAEIKQKAASHKVGTTSLVKTYEELEAAIANGYPVPVCSNQGFTAERDQDGFCQPRGSWSHCMLICGIRNDHRRGAFIANSWGDTYFKGPIGLDAPPFGFWADHDTVARMLAMEDSYAMSGFTGYPGQPLPGTWTYSQIS